LDEVFGVVRDCFPDIANEFKLTYFGTLISEGRDTTQENIGDDTTRPDIALFRIVLLVHFRGNI
jgi:hypothetical protein